MTIEESAAPSEAERLAILEPLAAFNAASGYPGDMKPIALLLRDPTGEIVGGLWGKTVYDWLYVEYLVVPEFRRGQDLGTRLMDQAEAIARSRACVGAWLTTFAYQARSFYEGRGYAVFGELPHSPRENVRIFMRKFFADDDRQGEGTDEAV